MDQNLNDIAELAESIGKRHYHYGKVLVEHIANKNGILIIYGEYGMYFEGLLCHDLNKFYMHINLEKNPDIKSSRIKFTIAHELGHYYIDNHRKKLKQGVSLSFRGDLCDDEYKRIEQEANHFASHLLMPRTIFCKSAKKYEVGLDTILHLKDKFETSIYSTTKHYINLNLTPSIMLKWNPDFTFHYASYSNSFSSLTGIIRKPPVRFPMNYIQEVASIINENSLEYFEAATPLSRWISTIIPGTSKDIVGLEQTIKLGSFGGITLLTF